MYRRIRPYRNFENSCLLLSACTQKHIHLLISTLISSISMALFHNTSFYSHLLCTFARFSLQFHYNFTLYTSFVSISLQFSLLTYFFNGGRELIRTNRGRGGTCSQISKHGSFAKKYETRAS